MDVVPVIDLRGGAVVRARKGDRASYRPIETPLSRTSDPIDVVAGYLSVHPFRMLYIADLDAIEGRGSADATIRNIAQAFPRLALWVDNGCVEIDPARRFLSEGSGERLEDARPRGPRPSTQNKAARAPSLLEASAVRSATFSLVLGSESQRDERTVAALKDDPRVILSLDFRGNEFVGPPALLRQPDLWPARAIVMTLARVGSGAGPDLENYRRIREGARGPAIYLAGGLRNRADLAAVAAEGAAGILVASAIHDGAITSADITAAASWPKASNRGE